MSYGDDDDDDDTNDDKADPKRVNSMERQIG